MFVPWRIRDKDILKVENGQVTLVYQNAQTNKQETKTVDGAKFLWLLMQHVLPKGFRRSRNYGFLIPNSMQLKQIQLIIQVFVQPPKPKARPTINCPCCGGVMTIIKTQIKNILQDWPKLRPTDFKRQEAIV